MKKLLLSLIGILCSMSMWADNSFSVLWDGVMSNDLSATPAPVVAASVTGDASAYVSGSNLAWGTVNNNSTTAIWYYPTNAEGETMTSTTLTSWTTPTSLTDDVYLEFTVTPTSTKLASLSGLEMYWTGSSGGVVAGVKYSIDGGATFNDWTGNFTTTYMADEKWPNKAQGSSTNILALKTKNGMNKTEFTATTATTAATSVIIRIYPYSGGSYKFWCWKLQLSGTVSDRPVQTKWAVPSMAVGAYDQPSGTYPVTLTCETGASINYTIGSNAEVTGVASGTIANVPANATITAYAQDGGVTYQNSDNAQKTMEGEPKLASPTYTITSYSYATGKYTVTCSAVAGNISYSTDSWVTTYSYTSPIEVTPGTPVKIRCTQSHMTTSDAVEIDLATPSDGEEAHKTKGAGKNDSETNNITNTTAGSSISGTYIAGLDGTEGLKLRLGRATSVNDNGTVNGLEIRAIPGYVITKVAWSNAISANKNDKVAKDNDYSVNITKCYVDGKEISFTAKSLDANDGDKKGFNVKGFAAKESVVFAMSSTKATQYRATVTVTYKACSDVVYVGAGGYSTYAQDYPFSVSGATVYKAKFDGSSTADLTSVSENIAAGEGVILNGTEGDVVKITEVASATALANNDLVGFTSRTALDHSANTYYVLGTVNDVTGFYRYTGENMPANKAALVVSGAYAAAKIAVRFNNGETTGVANVENVKSAKAVKRIMNGQLVIENAGKMYNAAGAEIK